MGYIYWNENTGINDNTAFYGNEFHDPVSIVQTNENTGIQYAFNYRCLTVFSFSCDVYKVSDLIK